MAGPEDYSPDVNPFFMTGDSNASPQPDVSATTETSADTTATTSEPQLIMSEQEALERIPNTITMGQVAAARMGEKAIQSIANDALRIDQNGDLVDHQKAVQIFGGDAKQLHDYMYATDPNFRARKDHWMQSDKPLEETQGPIEGGIFAYMLPGTALANSSKSMAGSITYDVAKDAWNSRNNH